MPDLPDSLRLACLNCATDRGIAGAGRGGPDRFGRCVHCRTDKLVRDRGSFSAIARAYRAEVETYCAAVSISHLTELSTEASAIQYPDAPAVEVLAGRRIEAGYTPAEKGQQAPMPQRLSSAIN